MSSRIENYLGFPVGASSADQARRAVAQASRFGVEILTPREVTGPRIDDGYPYVTLSNGSELSCHALMIATGVSYRLLDAPGIERLTGAGDYYGAAMTEAIACSDEDVGIVGGANSAGQAEVHFARYARRVTMPVQGDNLASRMSHYLVHQISSMPNITVHTNTVGTEAHGEQRLDPLTIRDSATGGTERLAVRSLFVFSGTQPHSGWLAGMVARDSRGFILSGPEVSRDGSDANGWPRDRDPFLLEMSVPGVFIAGDARHASIKRVASGVGEGSIAVSMVHQYLSQSSVA